MLYNLPNLEVIEISICDGMVELFSDHEGEITEAPNNGLGNNIELPKLKQLGLEYLYDLKRICSKLLVCNSLEKIMIKDCPNLKKFSLSINNTSHTQGSIEGNRAWWEALEWDDPATKELLLPLFETNY